MARILITGAAGFIGSTLAVRLLERGDSVSSIDNMNDLLVLSARAKVHVHLACGNERQSAGLAECAQRGKSRFRLGDR